MELKFSFTKQPSARSMVARTISADDMLRMTIAKLHAANAQNDRLTGELAAANQRIKAMQQRNGSLWDSYQDLRRETDRTAAYKEALEATKKAIKAAMASDGTTSATKTNLPPVESFCGHCSDCANLTDSRIAELLQEIDQVATNYASMSFGLPMYEPAIKAKMFAVVRGWVAKNGE